VSARLWCTHGRDLTKPCPVCTLPGSEAVTLGPLMPTPATLALPAEVARQVEEALVQAAGSLSWVDEHWTSSKATRGGGLPMCRAALARANAAIAALKKHTEGGGNG
jgi:hypothetical protein